MKKKRAPRKMGHVYRRPDSAYWWIGYSHGSKRYNESTHSTVKDDATDLLKRRLSETRVGRPASEVAKVTLKDLREAIDLDYRLNERRSGKRLDQAWTRITEHFGEDPKAISISSRTLNGYVTARLADKAKPGTIRLELAALRHAFKLALRSGLLLANEVPAAWPSIKPAKPREGFFDHAEHERVRAALPADEGDLVEFLFWTGWRKGEALGLRWKNVNRTAKVVRIETSKSGEPRTLPYGELPALVELIEHRRKVTEAVQKKRDMVVPHVFHRNGKPIRHFRRSWITACIKAGLGREVREPDTKNKAGEVVKGRVLERVALRIPHDYRRSAARNLSRMGVPERVIMLLCGWKTRSVFDRYRIVPEADLREGLGKLAQLPTEPAKVSPSS
jgi:integrase